jgi:hypothetical protein
MLRRTLFSLSFFGIIVQGFIYSLKNEFSETPTQIISEGPMYASRKGPFGETGDSTISVTISSDGAPSSQKGSSSFKVNLAFADSTNWKQFVTRPEEQNSITDTILYADDLHCCTSSMPKTVCSLGDLIVYPAPAGSTSLSPTIFTTTVTDNTQSITLKANYTAITEGPQYVVLIACSTSITTGSPSIPFYPNTVDIAFKNPYGFVPGSIFGFFPLYGALFVAYLIFSIIYGGLLLRWRKFVLMLQIGVISLVLLSVVETAVWFFMFDSKNRSGLPTPCTICGPVTSDYIFASILTVFKRGLSRVLLLAVAHGYSIVKPTLDKKVYIPMILLGVLYSIFGILKELSSVSSFGDNNDSNVVFVILVIDAVLFVWIFYALEKIFIDLKVTLQNEKLRMYVQLQNVMKACAVVYVGVAISILMIRLGRLPLDWKSVFFLINFWDVLYLLFIIGVAMIWAPGESTFLYASYNQPSNLGDGKTGDDGPDGPDTVDEAFEDEDYITKPDTVGIEMTNTSNKEESTTVKPKSTSSSSSSSTKPSTSSTTIKKSMTAPPAKGVRPAGVLVEVEDEDDDFADEFPPVQQQRTSDDLTGKLSMSSSTSSSRGIDTRTLAPPRDLKLKK